MPVTDLITGARRRGERLPVQVVLRILQQAADGLHAAHEARDLDGQPLHVVHRDVSPSNLLVDLDGVVRVADFGIARAAGRRAKTSTGLFKGKVGYLAPELLRFRPPDRRADLYALGVVLYEMLHGERLYSGRELFEVARRILDEPAPDLAAQRPDVPDALVELGFELLAKDPELRPPTAREVSRRMGEIPKELTLIEEPSTSSPGCASRSTTARSPDVASSPTRCAALRVCLATGRKPSDSAVARGSRRSPRCCSRRW